jgi:tRNA uridine 5-carbamoylmethylation protein Kti12
MKSILTKKIILLNGTSSSGKTSIIKELQAMYGDYQTLDIDTFQAQYEVDHPIKNAKEEYMREMMTAFFSTAHQLALDGKNVFVDTVQFDEHYDHYCSILNNKKTLKILVYCPLDVMVDHVEKRNKSNDKQERRTLSQALPQFKDIYKLQEFKDEIVVDTIPTDRMKHGLNIAVEEVRALNKASGLDPETNINPFVADFTEQFKLNSLKEIVLVAQHPWDLIVNSSTHSPKEIAQIISLKMNRQSSY